jgi:predicted ribosome quality control (RQC) complex YloA/Tae2 family protein
MRSDITALDLHFVVSEFSSLVGAKVEQVYESEDKDLYLSLHIPSLGKRFLRVVVGKFVYLAASKPEMPQSPPSFCVYLRKRLVNARVKSVRQVGFERIVELCFERKSREGLFEFVLYFELFSPGNVILCSKEGVILSVLEKQRWGKRILEPKEKYEYPRKDFDFFTLDNLQFERLLKSSDKENLVKTLAIDLGLGGVYAEEVCLRSDVDKSLRSADISKGAVDAIFSVIKIIRASVIEPFVVLNKQKGESALEIFDPGAVLDVVPFRLEYYSKKPVVAFGSFNSALDTALSTKVEKLAEEKKVAEVKSRFKKVDEIIDDQSVRVDGFERASLENQRKGELIYENYILVQDILKQIQDVRKRLSWSEIKAKLKGHAVIKNVDEAKGEITIELVDKGK